MSCPKPNFAASWNTITNAVEYQPEIIEDKRGKLVKQPDNAYVARVGRTQLYFLSSTLSLEEALEKKEQLDKIYSEPTWRLEMDFDTFDAWWYDTQLKKVVFKFKNEYARVFYAHHFNKGLDTPVLPEHPSGEARTVNYDMTLYEVAEHDKPELKTKGANECSSLNCADSDDCFHQNPVCSACLPARIEGFYCAKGGKPDAMGCGGTPSSC
ncbi:hypothetical protein CBS101457_000010 [Exobasidium rhododendri]|nr:hypothetical protein CBS101457_000010 [Exobasidium rhododendri]